VGDSTWVEVTRLFLARRVLSLLSEGGRREYEEPAADGPPFHWKKHRALSGVAVTELRMRLTGCVFFGFFFWGSCCAVVA
jgi:hypothetical protein